jgi:outer membrane receptor for monomeric catechols
VAKPTEDVSLYAAYGNARTPSSATVRIGCGTIPAPGAADPCATAPESAETFEIGAKASVFGNKLQLTAALFRNERSNFRVPSNDPSQPAALQVLDGRARVDGLAFGASGNISPAWTVFANYTYLDSEVLQSVSDFCRATPGATGCANSAAVPDPQAGQDMLQTPKHAGSVFTTYRFDFGLELGYGMTYQGGLRAQQPGARERGADAAVPLGRLPGPSTVRVVPGHRPSDSAAQRAEPDRRAVLHLDPQQRERDLGRDHRRVGCPGRSALGGAQPVLQLLSGICARGPAC